MMPLLQVEPELVPARMLNEYTYCPRLGYLMWVQSEWAESADTLDGTFVHRNVDREERQEVPTPAEQSVNQPGSDSPDEEQPQKQHARSLRLDDPELGLTAMVDVVELEGSKVTPIDYKRGAAPDLPEGAYEPERVQLCAQALLLRAAGYTCEEGFLWFHESRKRVSIRFDDALVERTKQLLHEFRTMAASGTIPPPLVDSPKCPRCSLVGICLPDETHFLQTHTDDQPAQSTLRLAQVPRADAMPLHVQLPYAKVSKTGDRLRVEVNGEQLASVRLHDISQVCLYGNIQVTTQALAELLDREIPVCYFTQGGYFRGMSTGLAHRNIELRIRQFQVAADPPAALSIARAMISGKIRNCRTLLRRNDDADNQRTLDQLQELASRAEATESAETLLGLEGMAAKTYFANLAKLIRGDFGFEHRNRRPPRDPVNAVLSFLYALLTKECHIQLQAAGLDPMLGVLHRPRYGRPALALDLAEEFRPLLADSVALTLFNTGELNQDHFIRRAGACAMTLAARRAVLAAWERRLSTEITHPLFRYVASYRRILAIQARLLGRTLTNELPQYPPFKTR